MTLLYGHLKQRGARVGISVLCPGVVNTRLYVNTDHGWDERKKAFCDDLLTGANPAMGATTG